MNRARQADLTLSEGERTPTHLGCGRAAAELREIHQEEDR